MPRQARLRIAGLPLHIVHRGNNRQACFADAHDFELYLGLLHELARRHPCDVHAYVLMTNHVHLLLTPEAPRTASALMKELAQRHSHHFNKRHVRTGALWEGRFHSSIVDSESYLFRCQRYIELNPVRAGMVTSAADYPWSSFGANAHGKPSLIVTPHPLYMVCGADELGRRAQYRALFDEPAAESELLEIRRAANGCFALGSDRFIALLESRLGRRAAARKAGRPKRKTQAA
jgi:putative transposase